MPGEPSAAVILAAGASRRFGRPKLVERVDGESLLGRTLRVAREAGFRPLVVVLGAHRRLLEPQARRAGAEIVVNHRWRRGMGTSLAAAAAHLLHHHPEVAGVVVVPADIPRLHASHLARLPAAALEAGLPAAATARPGAPLQAPAWLARELLPELLGLHADRGARDLLRADPARVVKVCPPTPLTDVDRPEDLPTK